MIKSGRALLLSLVAFSILLASGPEALGAQIAVILSSNSPAYEDALLGFQESYGKPVDVFNLSKGKPAIAASTHIIVAFGGKAASYSYPPNTTLIYSLAPSLFVDEDQHPGPRIRIYMAPKPDILMERLKTIQPTLKRLAVFWISTNLTGNNYIETLRNAAAAKGVTLREEHLTRVDEAPARLRALIGQADAMWLAPDPTLVTPTTFSAAKEFSRSNKIPLYAPINSLVDMGAVASVAASFKELGRAAGQAAARISADGAVTQNIYPDTFETHINLTAAAASGLIVPDAAVKNADRGLP